MNRHSVRSLMLLLALTGACGNQTSTTPTTNDMSISTNDMVTGSTADMATTPRDMTYVPPKLTNVSCTTATVTANTVYTMLASNCGGSSCHLGTGGNQPPLFGANGASLIAAVVNKDSSSSMKYVTPSDIDNSYLLYKVYNQQLNVAMGSGGQMPLGAMLSTTNLCLLVNWVRSGAK